MFIEIGVLFAFAAALCWGVGDFFIQRVVRKIGALESLAVIGLFAIIGLFPFVYSELHTLLTPENIALILGLGLITFIAAKYDFEALKIGKLSVIEIILEFELPLTIVLGILMFNEVISPEQFILIAIGFLGIVMMALESFDIFKHPKHLLEKGVALGLLGATGMAMVNFLTATASKTISPIFAIWAPAVIFTIITLILLYRKNRFKGLIKSIQQHKRMVIAMGIIDNLAWLSYAFALHTNAVSITTAITESYPAIALFLGLTLNREKIKTHQMIGAVLAIGGSIALAFFV